MKVYEIKKACPTCGGDLKGNEKDKFYCSSCELLFDRKHFKIEIEEKEIGEIEMDNTPVDLIEEESILDVKEDKKERAPKIETEPVEETGFELEETDDILVASDKSDKIHHGRCHFIKKIHKENRIYLKSIEEGQAQVKDLCVCLRRKGFK